MAEKTALILYGGWEGHEPGPCSELFQHELRTAGFEVERTDDPAVLDDAERLESLNLFVPMTTMGSLSEERTRNLLAAVERGLGVGGFHGGMGDAYRGNLEFVFMVGGLFVAHPDGIKEHQVNVTRPEDPIMGGMDDFVWRSEQYYMLVDPAVEVLASTTFTNPESMPWVRGAVMPVVWKRLWNIGRVFYSSLGHVRQEFEERPEILEMTKRGMLWAAR